MRYRSALTWVLFAAAATGLAKSGPAEADRWPLTGFPRSGPAEAGRGPIGHWKPARPVVAVNEPAPISEGCPIETADGLSLLFASNRSGLGNNDVWVSDRVALNAPWQPPRKLETGINDDVGNDFCPTPFGRSLLFVSDRATEDDDTCGGVVGGAGDIYLARQSPAGGWSDPVHLACAPHGPNTPGAERSPSLVETAYGTFLFYSTNGRNGDHDIFVSEMRRDGSFGAGRVVDSLSSSFDDFMPNVRERDEGGYEIVFNSNRPSKTCKSIGSCDSQDVFASVALFLPKGWTKPVNLGGSVNTEADEQRATLSRDGRRLLFGRSGEIYMSERR